jgi:hypothetical protein
MEHPDRRERDQFDLDHQVNTAPGLARIAYRKIQNLERGNPYQASWTTTVNNAFDYTHRYLKDSMQRYTFVDVGSGKGKVNLVWQQNLNRLAITQRNVGVDYYEPLNVIARNNWRQMFPNRPPEFYQGDAATYDFRRLGDKLIIYMFNPFSTMIMLPFLKNLKAWPTILIYTVPTGDVLIKGNGFQVLEQRQGQNQNENFTVYKNF